MTADLLADAERRMLKAIEALKQDLAAIRTGRASLALIERITVDYYGAPTPINQVASVSVPEARLLVIQPWDKKLLVDIEKAIQKSDLGINPNNDGQVIRLNVPPMNEERRRDLVKSLHKKLDEHKVAVRNVRRDIQDKLRDREKKKEVSEDELKRSTEKLQKLTDRYIDEMDKVGKTKEQEDSGGLTLARIQSLFSSTKKKEETQSQSIASEQQKCPVRHLAFIMDGNGRWATKRHLPRLAGHKAGVTALRRVVECAADENIEMLSVYAFSTENWGRPRSEVEGLMRLFWETSFARIWRSYTAMECGCVILVACMTSHPTFNRPLKTLWS